MTATTTPQSVQGRRAEGSRAEVRTLSIVVASVNGPAVLGPTLDAIDALAERDRIEVIVVDRAGGETREFLADRDDIRVIAVDEPTPIPRLRFLGASAATGDAVAFLEDHGAVTPGWAAAVFDGLGSGAGAIGGVVLNGRSGPVDDAVYYCEYNAYMGPVAEGDCADLPGCNIAYRRDDLGRHLGVLDEGKWESWITDRLRAEGVGTTSTNRMAVRHIKSFTLGYFLAQRFHFARSYAGMRRVDQSTGRRLAYGVGSLALPALLTARVARRVVAKPGHWGRFAACAPLVALFLTVGAVGEMIGYLAGPGDSLSKVE